MTADPLRRCAAWVLAGLGVAALAYVFVGVVTFAIAMLRVLSIG